MITQQHQRADAITEAAAKEYNIPAQLIKDKGRKEPAPTARHIAMAIIADQLKWSSSKIGRYMGGRDHRTVFWGKKNVSNRYDTDEKYRERFARIVSNVAKAMQKISTEGAGTNE